MVRKFVAAFLIFPIMPLILLAAATQIDWTQIKNKPNFATVATSGSYLDLSNRPSLWNDPGSGILLQRTGAFTFAAAVSGNIISVLGYTPENTANKGAASGYAPLDSGSQVPVANLRNCAEGGSHTAGQVPDPGSTSGTTHFFREDCSFTVPPTFVASGSSHAPGYVPDPGSSAGTARFLREDATWVTVQQPISTQTVTSNVAGTTYHNTGSGIRIVEITVSGANTFSVVCDSSSTPTTTIINSSVGVSGMFAFDATVTFTVLPNYYYKLTVGSGVSINNWVEWQ